MRFNKFFVVIVTLFVLLPFSKIFCKEVDDDYYSKKWSEVRKFEDDRLPKSALKVMEEINSTANKEKNELQKLLSNIKIIEHKKKNRLYSEFEVEKAIFEKIKSTKFPEKNIYHSVLAEFYISYFQRNSYRIFDRDINEDDKTDIEKWSANKFYQTINYQYNASLKNLKKLKNIPLKKFNPILMKGDNSSRLRPTLFDFLSHQYIDFIFTDKSFEAIKFDKPKFMEEEFIGDYLDFSEIVIDDSKSNYNKGAFLLQELVKFHKDDKNPEAYLDVEHIRLRLMYDYSSFIDKENKIEQTLKKYCNQYKKYPKSMEFYYELASLYIRKADTFYFDNSEKYNEDLFKAIEILNFVKKEFPKGYFIRNIENLFRNILKSEISLKMEDFVIANQKFPAQIKFSNIDIVKIKIEKLLNNEDCIQFSENPGYLGFFGKSRVSKEIYESFDIEIIDEFEIKLNSKGDYFQYNSEIIMPELDVGFYLISSFNNENKSVSNLVSVSNINPIIVAKNNICEVRLLTRENGIPVKNAEISIIKPLHIPSPYSRENSYDYEIIESAFTDENGYCRFELPKLNSFIVRSKKGEDYNFSKIRNQFDYSGRNKKKEIIFTDRAIYRPGQIVYFKGLVYEKINSDDKNTTEECYKLFTDSSFPISVELKDANYKTISSMKVFVNEFGTYSGDFVVPKDGLFGNFTIKTDLSSKSIKVEEYKIPKFEVILDPIKDSFKINEDVTITGKAIGFDKAPISGGNLEYILTRQGYDNNRYMFRSNPGVEIFRKEIKIGKDGKFRFTFKAEGDNSFEKKDLYLFDVIANVTDINGETQSTNLNVIVSNKSMELQINVPDKFNLSDPEAHVEVRAENLFLQPISKKVNVVIEKLVSPNRILINKQWRNSNKNLISEEEYIKTFPHLPYKNELFMENWEVEKRVLDIELNTAKDSIISHSIFEDFGEGVYKIRCVTKDKYGGEVKKEKVVIVFNEQSKKIPYKTIDWFVPLKIEGEPGENADFLIGSADNLSLIMQVLWKGNVVDREIINIKNEQKKISIPIEERFRGDFAVNFFSLKYNRMIKHNQVIKVPWTNKKLDFTIKTFRDNLKPGSKEEWEFSINDYKKDPVQSEILVNLYDSALDSFYQNDWIKDIAFPKNRQKLRSQKMNIIEFSQNSVYINKKKKMFHFSLMGKWKQYDRFLFFNNFGFSRNSKRGLYSEMAMSGMSVDGDIEFDSNEIQESGGNLSKINVSNQIKEDIFLRKNFQETAFFYPHLRTDKNGDFKFSFTMPDALTRWKLRAFAHTKDLKSGYLEKLITTQKKLSVIPNCPRFFRVGDEIEFSAKIQNLTGKTIKGKVTLELINPFTNKIITKDFFKKSNEIDFSCSGKENIVVFWSLKIPEDYSTVSYRIIAESENFSDGEEKAVIILKNRKLITETMSMYINPNQTKNYHFKEMEKKKSSTLKNHKFTLEFCSNPTWYAVQSLPFLMESSFECNEQIFSRFFANSVANNIVEKNPAIKSVFENWENTENSESFLSNLEKNQELKYALLEETPWIWDAENESERKKRISLLFDINQIADKQRQTFEKIKEHQNRNGSWAWFDGMRESRWVTQLISAGFGKLLKMETISGKMRRDVRYMMDNSIRYLDNKLTEDYNNLSKNKIDLKDENIFSIQINSLYTRSFFSDFALRDNKEAFDYYLNQAEKYWKNHSIYMQGIIALTLYRFDRIESAQKIMNSIKEYAKESEELGMYWDFERNWYYWYQNPIKRQALLIVAFDEIIGDKNSVNEMKKWLLKNKQTNSWSTSIATTEAIYALLYTGEDWLNDYRKIEIKLGGKKLNPEKMDNVNYESGTGYFKAKWSSNEINTNLGKIKLKNPTNHPAWGAIYWQYFENLDKIAEQENSLNIEKEIFVLKIKDDKKISIPIKEAKLEIGDRLIIRIKIATDRDLEYVHLKDLRASNLEPEDILSGYHWENDIGYYQVTRDVSTNFFFDRILKGSYSFEYSLRVTHSGDFSNGIATIQCMYAPEFTSHSKSERVKVGNK